MKIIRVARQIMAFSISLICSEQSTFAEMCWKLILNKCIHLNIESKEYKISLHFGKLANRQSMEFGQMDHVPVKLYIIRNLCI